MDIDKYSFLCYNVDMSTFGSSTPYFLYVYGESDDFGGGGRFSYRCPQAVVDVNYGRYVKKHCTVSMCNFPTDRLAAKLLPNPKINLDGAITWAAVYYGLRRFRDKMDMLPVTVRSCDEDILAALADGVVPERCQDWCREIINVRWMGVQFERVDEETVRRVIYGV